MAKKKTLKDDDFDFAITSEQKAAGGSVPQGDFTMDSVMDFSNIADPGPVPPGKYGVELTYAEWGTTNNGNPKIDLRFKITEEGEYENRVLFDSIIFTAKTLSFAKAKLVQLGLPSDWNKPLKDINVDSFVGIKAEAVVTIQKSKGTNPETNEPYPDRNRISRLTDVETPTLEVL